MTLTILVPLDGSELANRAIPVATSLAAGNRGRLVLMHVQSPTVNGSGPAYDPARTVAALREAGLRATLLLCQAPTSGVATTILRAARDEHADLIVMSTHGRGGLNRWIFGSVADQVMRRSDVPVVVVPPHCDATWAIDQQPQILVSLDGSRLAEEAIEPAARLATQVEAEILLVRALSTTLHTRYSRGRVVLSSGDFAELDDVWHYLAELADQLRAGGHRASVWVVPGSPAAAIVGAARTEGVDLIAMTTHGHGGLGRLVLGSIADGVLRRSHVPILLVRATMAGLHQTEPADIDRLDAQEGSVTAGGGTTLLTV